MIEERVYFGTKEHFRDLEEKLKDADYTLSFFYNLLKAQVEITIWDKQDGITLGVAIPRAMYEDKEHYKHTLNNFKSRYKKNVEKARKSFREYREKYNEMHDAAEAQDLQIKH